jgi:hypothetical protein
MLLGPSAWVQLAVGAEAARGVGAGHGVVSRWRRTQAALQGVAPLVMAVYICPRRLTLTDAPQAPRVVREGSSCRDSSHVVCSPVTSIS